VKNMTKVLAKISKIVLLGGLSLASFFGCTSKKDKPAYLSMPANSVTLTTFQTQTDPTTWNKDTSGKVLTNSSTITLGGYCSQGAAFVVIKIDGVDQGSSPDCNVPNRYWTYTGPFSVSEGDHVLTVYGKGKDGTEYTSSQVSDTITKDTVPPVITGFTNPTTDPFVNLLSPNITISATVTGGIYSATSTDSTGVFTINAAAGTFDFQTSLNPGETRVITFTAYDQAGNASSTMSRTIQYPGPINTLTAPISEYKEPGVGQTAPVTSGTTVLVNSGISTIGASDSYVSTNTAFVLETGLASSMAQ
jgi:hypothetical protein